MAKKLPLKIITLLVLFALLSSVKEAVAFEKNETKNNSSFKTSKNTKTTLAELCSSSVKERTILSSINRVEANVSASIVDNCTPPENPGFENGLIDWTFGTAASLTNDAAAGTYAARIENFAGSLFSTINNIDIEKEYMLSFQAKASSLSSNAEVSLQWLDAGGAQVGTAAVNIPNTANYTEFTISTTSPSDAVELLIFVEKQAGGTLYVDEFCLTIQQVYTTYTSSNVPINIATDQASTITSSLNIAQAGQTVEDLNLFLDISHTYVGDLDVTLISPSGTEVLVYNNHCGNNDNILFTVDDEAPPITCPPTYNEPRSAQNLLSAFDGEPLSGTWTLEIYDYYNADGGSLNAWGIEVSTGSLNICNNGADDDGDGLVDEYDPNCDCGVGRTYSIGSGAVESVESQTGVFFPENATGNPDNQAADLFENNDEIVLDLGFILTAGQRYSIFWHKKTSYGPGAPADIRIFESLNPTTGFVTQPFVPSTTELNSFVETVVTANTDTRYIKLTPLTGTGDDFQLDAVTYSNVVQCVQSEICDNGVDDDNDSLIDEADDDCDCNSCFIPLVQEYHIPFPEDQVFSSLNTIFPGNANNSDCRANAPSPSEPITSYISVSIFIDNSIIYFDHWEDNFETIPSNPTQVTSQIWGDGNPFNGAPPGIPTDILYAGTVIVLENNVHLATRQAVFDFDGGDRLATSFPVSVTRSAWADGSETLFAGALEVYPTSEWGLNYSFPAGENVDAALQYFEYVGAVVMASTDGTQLSIDRDANGVVETTVTLDKGQSYLISGGINLGGSISASAPVQVNLVTGDICDNYESRWLTLPPNENWSNDYISPVYGATQKYYVYNPSNSAMTVTVTTATNTNFTTLNIPAGGFQSFIATENSAYRLHNNGGADFYAYVLHDAVSTNATENSAWDWGAALLPLDKLSQQIITGWAPGQDPTKQLSENGSPIWVTAAYPPAATSMGPVTICIDYDGNSQGAFTDSYGRQYDASQVLNPLESFQIYDPDGDQTSTLIYICNSGSEAVLSAVWGQDNANASPGIPGLDVGTGIPGLNPYFAYKTVSLAGDIDGNNEYNVGDTVRYAIGLVNYGFVPISGNFSVSDILPSELTYVAGTTGIVSPAGEAAIADQGTTPFPLDEGGIVSFLNLEPGEEAQVYFEAVITSVPPSNLLTNVAITEKDGLTYRPEVTIEVDAVDEICENGIDDDLDGLIDCDCLSEGNVITGNIFLDEDENTLNNSEQGVQNIQVNIYVDQNGDGNLDSSDNFITSTDTDANGNYALEVAGGLAEAQVTQSADDAEEHRGFFFRGSMNTTRTYLNLGHSGSASFGPAIIGLRFQNQNIPQGAVITNAYLEFTANASRAGAGSITVRGEDSDNTNAFNTTYNNISDRPETDAAVVWQDVPSWFVNQTYQTPDIAPVIQEIVNRGGWNSGNDLTLLITGDTRRTAYSFNAGAATAPRLVVQYSIFPANYIVEIDNASILAYSAGASLTTAATTSVAFAAHDEYSCTNSFGLRLEEVCGNGTDDDFDGDIDCADTDCGIMVTANNNGPVCAAAVIQLTGGFTTGYTGTTTFEWTGPNGFTSTEQSPSIVNAAPSMAGVYTFTATNDSGCFSTVDTTIGVQADCDGICDQHVQVLPTNPTECFLDNGAIFVTEFGVNPTFYQNSIDGVNWFESEHTYADLMVGEYTIYLRDKATGLSCRAVNIMLSVEDETLYTGETVSAASDCSAADGSIVLQGVNSSDRVAWISSIDPQYVPVSSLSPANTITGLAPGTYYVRVVRGNNNYCYSERLVEVPSNVASCIEDLCVGMVRDNLFPDGDFGAGSPKNKGPLPLGETQYGYAPATCSSPNDGFYAVTNTSECDVNNVPFGVWIETEDHTPGDVNGYFLMVNASFNPDIAVEKTIDNLCPNTKYNFSLWIRDLAPTAAIRPNLTFLINGVGLYSTGEITATDWQQVGFSFFSANQTTMTFSIRNNAPGGYGNDWAIDDIFVGVCQPEITAPTVSNQCIDAVAATASFIVNDENEQYSSYIFQKSTDNGLNWTNYGTVQTGVFNSEEYTAQLNLPSPLTIAENNTQYRIKVATSAANLNSACELISDEIITINLAQPSVSAGADIFVCAGETVNLSATASGGTANYTYTWDNSLGAGQSQSFTAIASSSANSVTDYTVTVTDENGCTATDVVRVHVASTPNVTVSSNAAHCGQNNGSIVFSFTDHPNRAGMFFSIDDSATFPFWVNDADGSYTVSGLGAGVYNVAARWGDGNCPVDLGTIAITDDDGPEVTASPDVTVCVGETVSLSASASGGTGALTYNWSTLGTGASPTFTATSSATYTVTVTDAEGCTSTDDVSVFVTNPPSLSVVAIDEHCLQSDGSILLTFSDNPNQTQISFSIDGGVSYPYTAQDNAGSFVISGLSAGTYDVWSSWDVGNCPTAVQTVSLSNLAGPIVATSPDETVCEGEGLQISASASGGTAPYLYTWDNSLGNGAAKTVFPSSTTTYTVTATDNFGCQAIDGVTITILPYTDSACSDCQDPADEDGDGICASEDCDDNDPTLPLPVGTACDDGNPLTTNDVIVGDGCSCQGEYPPCATTLSLNMSQPVYNDNGTLGDTSDDTFTFTIQINGNATGWTANGQSGTYGQTATFGPYSVDASGVTFDVVDNDNPNCRENVSVNISSCINSGQCLCCQ